MKHSEIISRREQAAEAFKKANIVMTENELDNIEIADFGLGDFESFGLSLVIYANTDRYCAKEMALLPGQICPEHRHAPLPAIGYKGKQETFRCRFGRVILYVEGERNTGADFAVPKGKEDCFTAFHEIVLLPGQQYTIVPDTLHWFAAGPEGAVVSEFSSTSYDEYDVFTDPDIVRIPKED